MLNKNQKIIINDFLKFPFAEFHEINIFEFAKELNIKIELFNSLLPENSLTQSEISQWKVLNVWDSMCAIKSIFAHECPQNITTGLSQENLPYHHRSENIVYFTPIGFGKGIVKENKGLLGLTNQDDVLLYVNRENREMRLSQLKVIPGIISYDNNASYFILHYKVTANDVYDYLRKKINDEILKLKIKRKEYLLQVISENPGLVLQLDNQMIIEVFAANSTALLQLYKAQVFNKIDMMVQKTLINSSANFALSLYEDNKNNLLPLYNHLIGICDVTFPVNRNVTNEIISFLKETTNFILKAQILEGILWKLMKYDSAFAAEILSDPSFRKNYLFEEQVTRLFKEKWVVNNFLKKGTDWIDTLEGAALTGICLSENNEEIALYVLKKLSLRNQIALNDRVALIKNNETIAVGLYYLGETFLKTLNPYELFAVCYGSASHSPLITIDVFSSDLFDQQCDEIKKFALLHAIKVKYAMVEILWSERILTNHLALQFKDWIKERNTSYRHTWFTAAYWMKTNHVSDLMQWIVDEKIEFKSYKHFYELAVKIDCKEYKTLPAPTEKVFNDLIGAKYDVVYHFLNYR